MPSSIVAQVDDVKMTRGQLDAEVKKTLTALGDKVPPERKVETALRIRKQLVDDFVVRTLLTREVVRQKVSVKEEDVNNAIEDLKKTLPAGMTMEEMMKKNALTTDKLRQEVSLGLRINKLVAMEPASRTKPTDTEIQSFYKNNPDQFKAPETVSARHILVLKNKGDSEETLRKKREKAESIRKQLVGGADFAELARTSSDCPSKSNGGNLGSFSRGQMVKPFEEAAFKQKKGEIGPVVQTDFGYHIIQVLDHVPPKTMPLDGDMKTKIAAYLTQQKRYAAFNGLMERLKAKANISIAEKLD